MDISINRTGSQHVGVMSREVDVSNGTTVSMKRVFYGAGIGIFSQVEIPYESAVVGR
jgi:hypothetical protein